MVEHGVVSVKFLGLSCLALGRTSNLTSDDMADLQRQAVFVDGDNKPAPENIPN